MRCPAPASEGPFLTSGAGWRESREKTCTVPLSDDRASHCGLSPLLKAMLYMHAGSAPLRSSCVVALNEVRLPTQQAPHDRCSCEAAILWFSNSHSPLYVWREKVSEGLCNA